MLPDIGNRRSACGAAHVRQAIQIFKRAQDVEVVDGLGELTLLHHRADEDGRNLVVAGVIVFVPRDDQKAVMSLGKLDVGAHVLLQPGVPLGDGAVMHIVIKVRNDEGERGQRVEVRGEAGERLVRGCGDVAEIDPGRMLPRVGSGCAHRGASGRQVFRKAGEA